MPKLSIINASGIASNFASTELAFNLGFDEASGTAVYDKSQSNRHFTIQGANFTRSIGVNGNGGSSISQTKTGTSYIQANSSATGDVTTGNFSLATWIKPYWTTPVPLNDYILASKYSDIWFPYFEFGIEDNFWFLYTDFYTGGSNDTVFCQEVHNMSEGALVHIAFTVQRNQNGLTTRFYKNGSLHNSDTATGADPGDYRTKSLSTNQPFNLFRFRQSSTTQYGHHYIDDLWFFNNKLLSAEEVWDLYKVMA